MSGAAPAGANPRGPPAARQPLFGLPTVLLGPLIPEHLEPVPGRRWIGDIHHLVLDCDDEERVRRLTARPGWRQDDVDGQLRFAAWLRANLDPVKK